MQEVFEDEEFDRAHRDGKSVDLSYSLTHTSFSKPSNKLLASLNLLEGLIDLNTSITQNLAYFLDNEMLNTNARKVLENAQKLHDTLQYWYSSYYEQARALKKNIDACELVSQDSEELSNLVKKNSEELTNIIQRIQFLDELTEKSLRLLLASSANLPVFNKNKEKLSLKGIMALYIKICIQRRERFKNIIDPTNLHSVPQRIEDVIHEQNARWNEILASKEDIFTPQEHEKSQEFKLPRKYVVSIYATTFVVCTALTAFAVFTGGIGIAVILGVGILIATQQAKNKFDLPGKLQQFEDSIASNNQSMLNISESKQLSDNNPSI